MRFSTFDTIRSLTFDKRNMNGQKKNEGNFTPNCLKLEGMWFFFLCADYWHWKSRQTIHQFNVKGRNLSNNISWVRIITTLTRQTRQYTINLIWIAFLLAEHNGQTTTTTAMRSRNFSMSNNFASKIFFVSHSLNAWCDWIQLQRKEEKWTQGMEFIFCFHNHVQRVSYRCECENQ